MGAWDDRLAHTEVPALAHARSSTRAQHKLDMTSFPDRNPNPVMQVLRDGQLAYANAASEPILLTLGVSVGDTVPQAFLGQLVAAAASPKPQPFELTCDLRTFAILSVAVPGSEAMNVYGTDVTGRKVVEKFPDRNPHPVLRVTPGGRLIYVNRAAEIITRALGVEPGQSLPTGIQDQIRRRLDGSSAEPIEVSGEGHTYALSPVSIPEFDFLNLYGMEVTALHAINKFPDENPNPVLRVASDGTLTYANPASAQVRGALGVEVGDRLPPAMFEEMQAIIQDRAPNDIEVEHRGRIFSLRVVSLFEFESINVYGTDVTAAREVARANEENERLLLNILPSSIAARLRHGEMLIADSYEEMGVLFADVVDFTPYSAQRPAREVVSVLNQIFSIFDRLAEKHRLEKIKTVGDAYMVAGGLIPGGADARQVAEMALDMIDELGSYRTGTGNRMEIRVGLHVGPGIGGVIGLKKFIYDVWGDTVNTASRMESHGVPGRIQVMAETAERLGDAYRFETRGRVDVKGKGEVETAFLLGRRD